MKKTCISLVATFAALTAPVAAQETASPSVNIAGAWAFETGPYNAACRIHGAMMIYPGDTRDTYTCKFTTFEDCPTLSAEVEQACDVRVMGDRVEMDAWITNIVRQEPGEYGYAPDSWRLVIRSQDEMAGTLKSASIAEVIFRRRSVPIS